MESQAAPPKRTSSGSARPYPSGPGSTLESPLASPKRSVTEGEAKEGRNNKSQSNLAGKTNAITPTSTIKVEVLKLKNTKLNIFKIC